MYRLSWLVVFVILFLPAAAQGASKNVLLLISDNHSATDLGCYGHPDIRTPHLDKLAARGTRFSHAFATVASCGPSRGVINTGLLTHANGQYTHAHSFHNGVLARRAAGVRPGQGRRLSHGAVRQDEFYSAARTV